MTNTVRMVRHRGRLLYVPEEILARTKLRRKDVPALQLVLEESRPALVLEELGWSQ